MSWELGYDDGEMQAFLAGHACGIPMYLKAFLMTQKGNSKKNWSGERELRSRARGSFSKCSVPKGTG